MGNSEQGDKGRPQSNQQQGAGGSGEQRQQGGGQRNPPQQGGGAGRSRQQEQQSGATSGSIAEGEEGVGEGNLDAGNIASDQPGKSGKENRESQSKPKRP
jgi:hypothetical protein